jgi:hypothetical protein
MELSETNKSSNIKWPSGSNYHLVMGVSGVPQFTINTKTPPAKFQVEIWIESGQRNPRKLVATEAVAVQCSWLEQYGLGGYIVANADTLEPFVEKGRSCRITASYSGAGTNSLWLVWTGTPRIFRNVRIPDVQVEHFR